MPCHRGIARLQLAAQYLSQYRNPQRSTLKPAGRQALLSLDKGIISLGRSVYNAGELSSQDGAWGEMRTTLSPKHQSANI